MKLHFFSIALSASILTAAISLPATAAPKIKWVYSRTEANRIAKATGKPIFIDIYTTWCGPCKLLEKYSYSTDAFINESKNWVMLKIDGDKSRKFVEEYSISGYPTMLMTRPNGRVLQNLSGYWDGRTLVKEMKQAAKENKKKE